jgi:hypothetical protein
LHLTVGCGNRTCRAPSPCFSERQDLGSMQRFGTLSVTAHASPVSAKRTGCCKSDRLDKARRRRPSVSQQMLALLTGGLLRRPRRIASGRWVQRRCGVSSYWANSRAQMIKSNWGQRSVYVICEAAKARDQPISKVLQPHHTPGSQQGLHT